MIRCWSGAVFESVFSFVVQIWMKVCQNWCTYLERGERREEKSSS